MLYKLLGKQQFLTTKYSRYPSHFYERVYISYILHIQYRSSVYTLYKKTFFGK